MQAGKRRKETPNMRLTCSRDGPKYGGCHFIHESDAWPTRIFRMKGDVDTRCIGDDWGKIRAAIRQSSSQKDEKEMYVLQNRTAY